VGLSAIAKLYILVRDTEVNWKHSNVFCSAYQILCLQVEADDETGETIASDISDKSDDVVNSGVLPVRQVNSFIYLMFLSLEVF